MTAPGQLDLDGGEETDPRQERVARALFQADTKRANGPDGREALEARLGMLWPRLRAIYLAEARVALAAADAA